MKYKFINFMRGRYGLDELYYFFLYCYFFLFIINLFLDSSIISTIGLLIIIIMFHRFFSKDIYRRRKENINFLEFKKRLKNFVKPIDDTFIYKKCHYCHTTLRLPLPNNRGFKYVICPNCQHKNRFIILKKIHIEVIKHQK